jgi:hypothetical protein
MNFFRKQLEAAEARVKQLETQIAAAGVEVEQIDFEQADSLKTLAAATLPVREVPAQLTAEEVASMHEAAQLQLLAAADVEIAEGQDPAEALIAFAVEKDLIETDCESLLNVFEQANVNIDLEDTGAVNAAATLRNLREAITMKAAAQVADLGVEEQIPDKPNPSPEQPQGAGLTGRERAIAYWRARNPDLFGSN